MRSNFGHTRPPQHAQQSQPITTTPHVPNKAMAPRDPPVLWGCRVVHLAAAACEGGQLGCQFLHVSCHGTKAALEASGGVVEPLNGGILAIELLVQEGVLVAQGACLALCSCQPAAGVLQLLPEGGGGDAARHAAGTPFRQPSCCIAGSVEQNAQPGDLMPTGSAANMGMGQRGGF
jgi:hypothetical protein